MVELIRRLYSFAFRQATRRTMNKLRSFLNGHSPWVILPTISLAILTGFVTGCNSLDPSCPEAGAQASGEGGTTVEIHYSCDRSGALTKAESWRLIHSIDAFIFEDDGRHILDSYKKIIIGSSTQISVDSGSGDKKAVLIANSHINDEDVSKICCYEDLERLMSEFCRDDPRYPLMTGEGTFNGGNDKSCNVTLSPLMSVVEIRSLKFAFDGEWSGYVPRDVKVYLTGISNRCEMLRQDYFRLSEVLNNGQWCSGDMRRLPYSTVTYRYMGNGSKQADGSYSYGSASLYCYPNDCAEESLASPFTRIAITGVISGETYIWKIDINRSGSGHISGPEGIGRNTRYVFDITVTTPGESASESVP